MNVYIYNFTFAHPVFSHFDQKQLCYQPTEVCAVSIIFQVIAPFICNLVVKSMCQLHSDDFFNFVSSQVAIKIIDKTQLNPTSLQKVGTRS